MTVVYNTLVRFWASMLCTSLPHCTCLTDKQVLSIKFHSQLHCLSTCLLVCPTVSLSLSLFRRRLLACRQRGEMRNRIWLTFSTVTGDDDYSISLCVRYVSIHTYINTLYSVSVCVCLCVCGHMQNEQNIIMKIMMMLMSNASFHFDIYCCCCFCFNCKHAYMK